MTSLLHPELTYEVIGAAMEVHRVLGPGFLESVYQRAMEVELRRRNVAFAAQVRIGLGYKGESLGDHVLDLVASDRIVVEIKATKSLTDRHRAQLISYLKASRLPVGLLINFAGPKLEHGRLLLKDSLRREPPSSAPKERSRPEQGTESV